VPLTPRQQAFVREYLLDLNATQAAIRAGYSARSAEVNGNRLLRNAQVRRAVDEAIQKRAERLQVKADDVLEGLRRLAFFDPADFYEKSGALKNIHDIPKEVRMALAGFEVDELFEGHGEDRTQIGNTVKVKWWDRPKTLELLGKHLKLFTEKHEHTHDFPGQTDEQLEARLAEILAKRGVP
jgi:phage terminase small subunit